MGRMITEEVHRLSCYELGGSIENAIKLLQKLSAIHGHTARIEYGQHDNYDDGYSYMVKITREETEIEREMRIEAERKELTRLEELEMAELERLQKKYTE